MVKATDIAWLAGIIDGEGCFTVKRPIPRDLLRHGRNKTSYQLWLVLCNTSEAMVRRAAQIFTDLGVGYQPIRRVWKGDKATRWQYWVHVARKNDLLRITQALLPYLTAKKIEAEITVWFLTRACQVKAYKATKIDSMVLDTLSLIKRNGGEAPAEVHELLREVIPSQAVFGQQNTVEKTEGVETRQVSPNNNLAHECPTTLKLVSKSMR